MYKRYSTKTSRQPKQQQQTKQRQKNKQQPKPQQTKQQHKNKQQTKQQHKNKQQTKQQHKNKQQTKQQPKTAADKAAAQKQAAAKAAAANKTAAAKAAAAKNKPPVVKIPPQLTMNENTKRVIAPTTFNDENPNQVTFLWEQVAGDAKLNLTPNNQRQVTLTLQKFFLPTNLVS